MGEMGDPCCDTDTSHTPPRYLGSHGIQRHCRSRVREGDDSSSSSSRSPGGSRQHPADSARALAQQGRFPNLYKRHGSEINDLTSAQGGRVAVHTDQYSLLSSLIWTLAITPSGFMVVRARNGWKINGLTDSQLWAGNFRTKSVMLHLGPTALG